MASGVQNLLTEPSRLTATLESPSKFLLSSPQSLDLLSSLGSSNSTTNTTLTYRSTSSQQKILNVQQDYRIWNLWVHPIEQHMPSARIVKAKVVKSRNRYESRYYTLSSFSYGHHPHWIDSKLYPLLSNSNKSNPYSPFQSLPAIHLLQSSACCARHSPHSSPTHIHDRI